MPTSRPESPRPTGPASGPASRGTPQASSDGDDVPGDLVHPIGPSFRHFAESLADLVWSARPDGFCDYFNGRFLDYLGTTLDEMRAVEWTDTLHPDDVGRCRRAWEDAYTTGGEYEVEYRLRRHDGLYRWHRGHATPMRDDSGRIARWFGTCTDIDDRRRAEERERLLSAEAATANARFRAFFEQGALFAGIMAVDGTIIEPNRLSLEGCGYTREQVVGRPFWECPWWSKSAALAERIKAASARAAAGETFRAEMPYFVADGSQRIVDLILLPIRDEAGRVVFLAPTGTDITDRKRAEEEVRLSHARFEAVLDAAPIGVYVVDADLRIRQVNPKARPVFGDIEGLIGRDFVEVIHLLWTRAYAAEVVGRFRHTLATGEPCFVPERIEERLDRRVLEYYEWQVHRISLPGGRYGVVCYFSDVSRHVLARQALAEADRRKDEFLAMLAHELRNPLAPIRTGLEILRYAEGDDRPIEPLRAMMERQVDHLTRLVDDLMDVSRITRGKIELRKEVVDLGTVLGHVVEASRPAFVERRHELIVGWPEGPIHLEADPTRLEQILDNLLNNACKYTDPGGCIRLTAGREGGSLVLRVRDTGIGIAPEKLPCIFDLFMQAERRLDRSQGGLGIGLSLVRSLAEMHGGEVTARSDGLGRGSEFILRLPALPPTSVTGDRTEPGVGLEPAPSLPRRRILVVDDNPDSARTMAMMLRRSWGQEVEVAHDGTGAIEVALTFRPELLLLDLGLPGMSGYEVARRLRERPEFARTLIVAMTGWGREEDRRRSQEAGFDHHLVKPVDPEVVRGLIGDRLPTAGRHE